MQGISGMFQNVHSPVPNLELLSVATVSVLQPVTLVKCWKKCQAFKKLKNQRKNAVIPKTTDHLKPTLLSVFKKKNSKSTPEKTHEVAGTLWEPLTGAGLNGQKL